MLLQVLEIQNYEVSKVVDQIDLSGLTAQAIRQIMKHLQQPYELWKWLESIKSWVLCEFNYD